jgi:hypothetical protein
MRTGFTSPLRPSLRLALDGITHPRWSLGTALCTLVREGMPHFENYGPARGATLFSSTATIDTLRDALCWNDLEEVRAKWKGRLVIKGVLAREDVRIARETGADGIVVSNHGGRQLDGVVTSLQVLPELASEAGTMAVLFDGGVRRVPMSSRRWGSARISCSSAGRFSTRRRSPARPASATPSICCARKSSAISPCSDDGLLRAQILRRQDRRRRNRADSLAIRVIVLSRCVSAPEIRAAAMRCRTGAPPSQRWRSCIDMLRQQPWERMGPKRQAFPEAI